MPSLGYIELIISACLERRTPVSALWYQMFCIRFYEWLKLHETLLGNRLCDWLKLNEMLVKTDGFSYKMAALLRIALCVSIWALFQYKDCLSQLPCMEIASIKIRWLSDHLIFIMEIPVLVRWHLHIRTDPCLHELRGFHFIYFSHHVMLNAVYSYVSSGNSSTRYTIYTKNND